MNRVGAETVTYYVMSCRRGKYHKRTVYCGFLILEKFQKEILRFCAEFPHLPLSPEEIRSDLIIDRMPRFLRNCQFADVHELTEVVEADLSAVKDKRLYRYNVSKLIDKLNAENRKAVPDQETLQEWRLQVEYLHHLESLVSKEKQLLTYLRSCIRRTKIKYLQSLYQTAECRTTFCADPTNRLQEVPESEDENDLKPIRELLDLSNLGESEKEIIIDGLILEKGYAELGAKYGLTRTSAARKYQEAMRKFSLFAIDKKELFHVE